MTHTSFDFFYHNGCPEFQAIKRRIWEFNNPTERQLSTWRRVHWTGGYQGVVRHIQDIREQYDALMAYCEARFLVSRRRWAVADFTVFAFDKTERRDLRLLLPNRTESNRID